MGNLLEIENASINLMVVQISCQQNGQTRINPNR
jgi:hypothetical protein